MRAVVTGGEGGIGRAIRARLESEGYEVESLDLTSGFDVTDPAAWERVGAVELACLNAGVLTGEGDPRRITDEQYRRAVAVNVDGVFFGVRRLAQVMESGAIVATASLAGLTAMPTDVIYSLTKHAVVGLVRSVAPLLEPIRVNAVCPGIADTPMIDHQRAAFAEAGFPLLAAGGGRGGGLARGDERGDRRMLVRAARARAGAVSVPEPARAPARRGPRRPSASS